MAHPTASTPAPSCTDASDRRPVGFLLIYALAHAGGVIGYLPLLTLLLPMKVATIAGPERLGVLTVIIVAGALTASLSNILFGWLSDRSVARGGGRRSWLAGGILATALSYGGMAGAASSATLLLAVIAFQIAVNALLAPLLAIMADEIPDGQKGVAGGLLAMAQPLAAALSVVLLATRTPGGTMQMIILPLVVAACTIPLLLTRMTTIARSDPPASPPIRGRRDLVLAWTARLLVQIAGSALFAYLLYYLGSIAPAEHPGAIAARMGTVMLVAYCVPLPIAVLIGRLADRGGRIKPFLFAAAFLAAMGLVAMAAASDFGGGAVAFGVYTVGVSVFLALHASFAMQLLPSPRRRGRDLGLLNLSNTLPGVLGPLLTWSLATPTDFAPVMLALAALTLSGGFIILAAGPSHFHPGSRR